MSKKVGISLKSQSEVDAILSSVRFDDLLAPHLLPLAPSGWHELVPLGHWLIEVIRPRVFVELGSHAGVSLSAFCSAMKEKQLAGRAYAIDTWAGDAHAGHYDSSIYSNLREFVEHHFSEFTTLLKMPFDEALDQFSDGTIDLLHIDGLHTYQAVKHDFETWKPKLSERGVVIFHDVNCINPGFEVWRLWDELTAKFPTFEFPHGNGLGIVSIGDRAPTIIRQLTALSTPQSIASIRKIFALAGHSHGELYAAHQNFAKEISMISADREAVDKDRHQIDINLKNANLEIQSIRTELAFTIQERDKLQIRNDALKSKYKITIENMETKLRVAEQRHLAAEEDTRKELFEIKQSHLDLQHTHAMMTQSRSWRVTAPLRKLQSRLSIQRARLELLRVALKPDNVHARQALASAVRRRLGMEPLSAPNSDAFRLSEEDRTILEALVRKGKLPSIGVIVFANDGNCHDLRRAVQALDAQDGLPIRQIFIHASESSKAHRAAQKLARERNTNVFLWQHGLPAAEHISAWLVLSASVELIPEAAALLASEMHLSDAQFVYGDEAFKGKINWLNAAFYKPSYSPRLAASSNYMGACALIKAEVGGTKIIPKLIDLIEKAVDISAGLTSFAAQLESEYVGHTPFVICYETDKSRRVLSAPQVATVPVHSELVAIVIPTRDRLSLLKPCVESIIANTAYPRASYQIIVVDNGSVETETLDYLADGATTGLFTVIRDDSPFNYARLNNLAAKQSDAEILVFLNNDTLIIQSDWLTRMVHASLADGVGMVGAKLLYEDGTVQHGGVVLGIQGVAAHADVNILPDAPGYHGLAQHDREVSAVTGACMSTRRDRFWQVGGFDENLAVAFNDTLLCINMLKAGYVNLQLNSVKLIHLESKSRGHDITPAQQKKFLAECKYARSNGQKYFIDDRYYSPNLSLQDTYKIATFPRRRKPWRAGAFGNAPRILILSCTHQRGHGVPLVIEQHVAHMRSCGFDVHIGGHSSTNDIVYHDCIRVTLESPLDAVSYAIENDIDIIIPHTPPFFSVSRWAGPYPCVIAYDHGEPPPSMFPDSIARESQLQEKKFALSLMHRLYCNSHSVREESGFSNMIVVPLGNSHMDHWGPEKVEIRQKIRERNGWLDKVIVLNVCRFHAAERFYKGVDLFIATQTAILDDCMKHHADIVFVQCGKATPQDVQYVTASGVTCFANVTDEEMMELYCAADIYANFSQWEGWNLGIAQALAYGLPVVASDIAAHRNNFDVILASTATDAATEIVALAEERLEKSFSIKREAKIETWESKLTPFVDDIQKIFYDA